MNRNETEENTLLLYHNANLNYFENEVLNKIVNISFESPIHFQFRKLV